MFTKFQLITLWREIIVILLVNSSLFSGNTTAYTPEGKPVPADNNQEMSAAQIAECHRIIQEDWIIPYSLNAVRIGDASNKYNCHGYAWSLSEGGNKVWIGTISDPDVEVFYWTDQSYSNDGRPSYIDTTESEATHAWYTDGDHSVRKIQNSYPYSISGGRNYVSKWGYFGLYHHEKGHDIYKLKSTSGFLFKKLKTTHYGTLNSHPKVWIGAGGKTHTITGNLTVPAGTTLTIQSGVTVSYSGSAYITVQSGGSIIAKALIPFSPSGSNVYYSGIISINNTWGFPVLLTDNLTVNSSKTLTILPGSLIKVYSGKKLTVNGVISATGTSSQKITFQASSGTWSGIELNYCGNTSFNYCTIKNATCGIRAYHTSPLYVENCTIENNSNGLTFDNQSAGYVRYSKIKSNSSSGGIICSQNSNPVIRPNNQILNNTPTGLTGDYNSLPELGTSGQHGNNSIFNSYDDVWSENSV